MSKKQRISSNPTEKATLSLNERILRECHGLYADQDKGLVSMAKSLDLSLLTPRNKITVLLIGNHSAGKSSFINWYVEEHVQKTGVAIETQGFTFVTSGKKRETLTGNATLHLYPHFKPLQRFEGVVEYLTTEISTSKQKKFSVITFIDTPGLVDGDMLYPFDVDKTIEWLGNMADLIFVFFDPIGQALCKRTLNIVQTLNGKHGDRLRFYLSKADTAGTETDRQASSTRVMMQITQELCKRPGLNKTGFDMPTIYVPSMTSGKPIRCENQIEDVCKTVEKTISQTIQNTLNSLEKDCQKIADAVDEKLRINAENSSYNLKARGKGFIFGFFGLTLPLLILVAWLTSLPVINKVLGSELTDTLKSYLVHFTDLWNTVPEEYKTNLLIIFIVVSLLLLYLSRWMSRLKDTMSRKQIRRMMEVQSYVTGHVKTKKEQLYQEYLTQSIGSTDLS
ncbi:EH domain-containing protein 2 [Trichoplax sp. H2]|nr:EH domain-containing protein 2 [Trichoplax sp. H2]|eukprot:RDD42893.1 EH domain-containing protein 2 [Trichoplax sp. H2]